MCAFRDEVCAMRVEVTELMQVMQRDLKSFESVNCVLQDVTEIKMIPNLMFPATTYEHITFSDQMRSYDTSDTPESMISLHV